MSKATSKAASRSNASKAGKRKRQTDHCVSPKPRTRVDDSPRFFIVVDDRIVFKTDIAREAIDKRFELGPTATIVSKIWDDAGGAEPPPENPPYPPSNPVAYGVQKLSDGLLHMLQRTISGRCVGRANGCLTSGHTDRARVTDKATQRNYRTATNEECAELTLKFETWGIFDIRDNLVEQFGRWCRAKASQFKDAADAVAKLTDDRNIDLIRSFINDPKAFKKFSAEGNDIDHDGKIQTNDRFVIQRASTTDLIERMADINKEVRTEFRSGLDTRVFAVVDAENVTCETTNLEHAIGFAEGRDSDAIVVGLVRPVKRSA